MGERESERNGRVSERVRNREIERKVGDQAQRLSRPNPMAALGDNGGWEILLDGRRRRVVGKKKKRETPQAARLAQAQAQAHAHADETGSCWYSMSVAMAFSFGDVPRVDFFFSSSDLDA